MSIQVRYFEDLILFKGNIPAKSEAVAYAAGDLVSNGIIELSAVWDAPRGFAEVISCTLSELKDAGSFQDGTGRIILFGNPETQLTAATSNDVFALGTSHIYSDLMQLPFVDTWVNVDAKLQQNYLDLELSKRRKVIQVTDSSKLNLGLAWVTDSIITYPDDGNEIYYELILRKHYGITCNG